MLAQACHDGGVRVPVTILEPGRDHGERRLHGAQELLGAAGAAPMVGDLEHVGGAHILGVEHLLFDSALHIAAQEQAALPEGHAHHQGVVILRLVTRNSRTSELSWAPRTFASTSRTMGSYQPVRPRMVSQAWESGVPSLS